MVKNKTPPNEVVGRRGRVDLLEERASGHCRRGSGCDDDAAGDTGGKREDHGADDGPAMVVRPDRTSRHSVFGSSHDVGLQCGAAAVAAPWVDC